jgi:hypothetical protein
MGSNQSVVNTVTDLPKSITVEEREAREIIKLIMDAQRDGRNNIKIEKLLSSNLKKELKHKNYEINELITIKKKIYESSDTDGPYKFIYKDLEHQTCWIEMCCCCIPICMCSDDDANPPFTTIKWKLPEKDIELRSNITWLPASAPPAYNQ